MRHPPLIWLDIESTGIDPRTCKVLEIALVVTDGDLRQLAEPFSAVVWQPSAELARMDAWCTNTHTASGLVDAVIQSTKVESEVEAEVLTYLTTVGCVRGESPICGNTIAFDRVFLRSHMPAIDSFGHYRSIDVTSISEVIRRWAGVSSTRTSKGNHRALPDILASIDQLAECRRLMAGGFVAPSPLGA
jgi:oligoribonuclease